MNLDDFMPGIEELVEGALEEDLAGGDVTTDSLIRPHAQGRAHFLAKANGVLAGIEIAGLVFHKVDPFLKFTALVRDGSQIKPGDVLANIEGNVAAILKGERTALNFLQHLSGIASQAAEYVDATRGLPVKIMDTRKTIPGLRVLEKWAVSVGGGTNHRMSLGDMVLIKDNHIAILRKEGLNIRQIVEQARKKAPKGYKIEIETASPEEALEAALAGSDVVMLDNMSLDEMRRAVKLVDHRAILEASGGVNLGSVRAVAETGVDWISIGALTHSARALDISLKTVVF